MSMLELTTRDHTTTQTFSDTAPADQLPAALSPYLPHHYVPQVLEFSRRSPVDFVNPSAPRFKSVLRPRSAISISAQNHRSGMMTPCAKMRHR
jgi:hypothetical protein